MDEKSNSIRPKTFAKWSTPECQDLFDRRSSQILIKQLHLSTYMCHLECSTLLLNRVLTPDGIFFLHLWSTPDGIFFLYLWSTPDGIFFLDILVEYSRSPASRGLGGEGSLC